MGIFEKLILFSTTHFFIYLRNGAHNTSAAVHLFLNMAAYAETGTLLASHKLILCR